jgi:hypothetical protein
MNNTNCTNVALPDSSPPPGGNGNSVTCTITNTLNVATLEISKVFTDGSTTAVTIGLTCTSGAVTPPSQSITPGTPGEFTITGFTTGATCDASETPPDEYTADLSDCTDFELETGENSCTVTNMLANAIIGGIVIDEDDDPIEDAKVTLFCGPSAKGPFTKFVFPNKPTGIAVSMMNPIETGKNGLFAWEVPQGFCKVRAEAKDCVSNDEDDTYYAESDVYEVPPGEEEIVLVLDCDEQDRDHDRNDRDDDRKDRTKTPTPTPTKTPTPTPIPTATPNYGAIAAVLNSLNQGAAATPVPAAPVAPAVPAPVIRPPSTGDAGLVQEDGNGLVTMLVAIGAFAAAGAFAVAWRRYARQKGP